MGTWAPMSVLGVHAEAWYATRSVRSRWIPNCVDCTSVACLDNDRFCDTGGVVRGPR